MKTKRLVSIQVTLLCMLVAAGCLVRWSTARVSARFRTSGEATRRPEQPPPNASFGRSVAPPPIEPTVTIPNDVIIGTPREISYSRAFPLLDGLFQDVSAIQLTQLQLNANQPNASNLDALIQQFQATIQYSQTLGLQNAAASQQAAAFSASGALQTQLLNQASQLINLQLSAQQQVGQAQVAVNSLPANATDQQKAAAQLTLALANDNLTAITAQATSVKALLGTSAPTAPNFTAPAPTPIAFPTPVLTLAVPGSSSTAPFSPSFPASKQMDNQVSLLWERLAQLVNTLAESKNPNGISLVKFHTGITGAKDKRKHQLLSTQYTLKCSAPGIDAPQVLDLFPRNAAVNINDMKYKDSRFGLAAILSFFSIGSNIGYNREHLRVTQALGQSAYITGFGIETSSFGWVFSPSLGEDVIAPGDRTTFALVAAPEGCGDVTVNLAQAVWDKAPVTVAVDDHTPLKAIHHWPEVPVDSKACDKCLTSLEYAPVEFDPAAPGSLTVAVDLKFDVDLDRELTITANGIVLKRARDNYGRATAAGGSGGLLQSATLDVGTWIPLNRRELLLQLNPVAFSRHFPSLVLTSPERTIDVSKQVSEDKVRVSGFPYSCGDRTYPCAMVIPPIGRPKAAARNFAVARWAGSEKFIITLQQPFASAVNSPASDAIPAVQVLTGSRSQSWSGYAKVVAVEHGDPTGTQVPLTCTPLGERLLCDMGEVDQEEQVEFEIFDPDFAGGAVRGSGFLQGCSGAACSDSLIWEMDSPRWDKATSSWVFHLSLINVTDKQIAYLDTRFHGEIKCDDDSLPCGVDIPFPLGGFESVRDTMSLQVYDPPPAAGGLAQKAGNPSKIGNLRKQISPVLSFITDDQTRFSGQNLVVNQILVGNKPLPISCTDDIDCFLPSPGFGAKDEGYLYFVIGAKPYPFMQITDKGLQAVAPHKPKPAPSPATPPAPTQTPTLQQTLQIEINPATRLNSIKEQ